MPHARVQRQGQVFRAVRGSRQNQQQFYRAGSTQTYGQCGRAGRLFPWWYESKTKNKKVLICNFFFFFSRHWYRRVETFHVHEQEYDAVRHMPVGGPIHGYLFLFFCFVLFCFADRICRPEGPTTRDAPVPAHAPPRPRACADPQDSLHGRQDRGRDWVDRPRV